MRKTPFIPILIACFVGVLAAMQFDHWLNNRSTQNDPKFILGASHVTPAGYETGAAVAAPVDFRAAAKKVIPAVVSVDRYERQQFFDETGPLEETATGSGVVVGSDGIIVTNNHVVAGAEQVRVRTTDKRTLTAKVVGTDPRSDLAVLRVDAKNLTPIELGDNDQLQIGEWVMAVGNPLGFDSTVSVGVVSSVGRSVNLKSSFLFDGIQTDAAINPGNSGGALTNTSGQLIGINSAIATNNQGSIGIGFAIPVNRMKTVVNDILKKGYVPYAGLGVGLSPKLEGILADPQARQELTQMVGGTPPTSGILLAPNSISPGSAADKIGMKAWDVIEKLDGQDVGDSMTLNKILFSKKPGDKVKVTYWSKGQVKSGDAVLQELHPVQ